MDAPSIPSLKSARCEPPVSNRVCFAIKRSVHRGSKKSATAAGVELTCWLMMMEV